jgi:hypothetical protein
VAINLLSTFCEPIRNEVFRAHDVEKVLEQAAGFFGCCRGARDGSERAVNGWTGSVKGGEPVTSAE